MARNIRWYLPFRSMNDVQCRVNIYDNDWPAHIEPMRLTGAPQPITCEDDDSDDLLNDVARYQTGYIRIVDTGNADETNIAPQDTFDRYVEVLYGSDVVFRGYIKVQEFYRALEPTPSAMELPVVSTLGLADKINMPVLNPPFNTTLAWMIDRMLVQFSQYERIYTPYNGRELLVKSVNTLVFSPWNEDFHHGMTVSPSALVMKPMSYSYLVECVCKAFGWICHDTPSALVFTSFDYQSTYVYWPAGHIGDPNYMEVDTTPIVSAPLTDFFSVSDNKGTKSTILPDTGIEMGYDGNDDTNVDFSFERTTFRDVVTHPGHQPEDGESYSVCNLDTDRTLSYEIITSGHAFFNTDGTMGPFVSACVAYKENIGILTSVNPSWNSPYQLFSIRLYNKNLANVSWRMEFQGMASYIQDTDTYTTNIWNLTDHKKVTDYYITASASSTANYTEVTFYYQYGAQGSSYPPLPNRTLLFVHDIVFTLLLNNEPYAKYKIAPTKDKDILSVAGDVTEVGNYPAISSSITLPVSCYRLSDHLLGDSVMTQKITTYPYLFHPRDKVVQQFRTANAPTMPYLRLFSYLGKNWRIIARSFNPWNDEYTLTLQSSPLLNTSA